MDNALREDLRQKYRKGLYSDKLKNLESEFSCKEKLIHSLLEKLESAQKALAALKNDISAEKARIEKVVEARIEHELRMRNDSAYAEKHNLAKEFQIFYADLERYAEYLLPILRKLKQNQRISAEDEAWLTTKGEAYFNRGDKIYEKHHYIQAQYHLERYKKHQDFWSLVNASSHFRKANSPRIILPYLEAVPLSKIHKVPAKQQSALFTTFGGVKRDVGSSKEALELAHQGHEKNPSDYRPCTLLGALYIECGQYAEGTKWFDKAESLGAPRNSTDRELRAIYQKASKEEKERLKEYLLKLDPKRYSWCKKADEPKRG